VRRLVLVARVAFAEGGNDIHRGADRMRGVSCWLAIVLLGLPCVARAGDGRLEINQSCLATGCVPGDAPGIPVETQANQSYVLTSNLALGVVVDPGFVLAAGATLDLNGFTISGQVTCSGTPAVCSDAGVNSGGVSAGAGAVVRNGTIRGMRGFGIRGDPFVRVEHVVVEQNAAGGISTNGDATGFVVQDSEIRQNGGPGIHFAYVSGALGARVLRNTIHGNAFTGVQGALSLLTDNAITANAGVGAVLGYAGSTAGYGGNQFWNNNGGNANAQVSGGVAIGPNVCGTGICP